MPRKKIQEKKQDPGISQIKLQKGDKVIHPYHGGGIVVDIIKRELKEEMIEYYLVNIVNDSLNLYIPTNSINKANIKKIESKKSLDECLKLMGKNNFKLFRKPALLETKVKENLEQGELIPLVEAIGLIERFKSKREKEGKISPLNKNLLDLFNHAKKLLISRIALLKELPYSSAQSYFEKIVKKLT